MSKEPMGKSCNACGGILLENNGAVVTDKGAWCRECSDDALHYYTIWFKTVNRDDGHVSSKALPFDDIQEQEDYVESFKAFCERHGLTDDDFAS